MSQDTKTPAAGKVPAKLTLVAVEPILSGGVRYEPGAPLVVDKAAAAQLLDMGAAKLPEEPAADAT